MNTPAANYNPDVLSCLANLSNDEVFTPPDVVNSMLDMLPDSLWKNPDARFLDPCCKTGVFLREIAKRLNAGLATLSEYVGEKNLQKRLDHIFETQLYGIAITELTSLLSRRSVYCSKTANGKYSVTKFDSENGNIFFDDCAHTWVDGKCTYCGASESEYGGRENLESHAYQFIHNATPEEISKMKFDVVIGNPPYQMSDGGNGVSAKPIYHLFVREAKKIAPSYLCMIIQDRWFAGGKGLDDFRNEMLNDNHIKNLVDYTNANDCFPGVDIAGGICYFLRDKHYSGLCNIKVNYNQKTETSFRKLNEFKTFIRYGKAVSIINKIKLKKEKTMDLQVSSRKPFGLPTNALPQNSGELTLKYVKGEGPYKRADITQGIELIDKYKVITSKTSFDHAGQADKDGTRKVLLSINILPPKFICTETYIVAGTSNSLSSAENLVSYLKTKFVRFLIAQLSFSQDITKDRFAFVPLQDFSEKSDIDWSKSVDNIDHQLYKKYNLTPEEILFIESMIRPMDTSSQGNAHV